MNLIFTLFTRTYIKNLSSETYEDAGKEHWIQHKIMAPDEVAAQVSFKLQHPHLEICGCEQEILPEWALNVKVAEKDNMKVIPTSYAQIKPPLELCEPDPNGPIPQIHSNMLKRMRDLMLGNK